MEPEQSGNSNSDFLPFPSPIESSKAQVPSAIFNFEHDLLFQKTIKSKICFR